jgi:hypothetical protein
MCSNASGAPSVKQGAVVVKVRHAHQASVENAGLCDEANTCIIAVQVFFFCNGRGI